MAKPTPKPTPTHESWMGEGVSVAPGTKGYNDYKKSQMELLKSMVKTNTPSQAKKNAVAKKVSGIPAVPTK